MAHLAPRQARAEGLSPRELRARRQLLGLTQSGLAEELSVSANTVARWERGEIGIRDAARVVRILDGLNWTAFSTTTLAPAGPPNNLPSPVSSFVGRSSEVPHLASLVQAIRLLTLVGPGGVGKTRLAIQVARQQLAAQRHEVWFVDLSPVRDPSLVLARLASTLRVRQRPDQPLVHTLIESLRARQVLLVLDNCEQVVDACAGLVNQLLECCPTLRVLATSRQPLRIVGETVWAVAPLAVPGPPEHTAVGAVLASDAGRLFLERAIAARSSFRATDANAPLLARICNRLDGMPLAIELAAVGVRSLGIGQIVARLDDGFRLLSDSGAVGPSRHQTLQAVFDWSYDLLSGPEQTFFQRLAIFANGCTLEAAQAVCGAAGQQASDISELLMRLVDRSLVVMEEHDGTARYRLLETTREYASNRLKQSGEDQEMRERHRTWVLSLAEKSAREIWGTHQVECVQRLRSEHDNLRAALNWSLTGATNPEPGLRIAASLVRFWEFAGELHEGAGWLAALLALPTVQPGTLLWAQGLTGLGYLNVLCGNQATAVAQLEESLVFWRRLGEPRALAIAVFFRGVAAAWYDKFLLDAVAFFTESLALASQKGPAWVVCFSLYGLGEAARLTGALDRAEGYLSRSLAVTREHGDRWGGFHALLGLSLLRLAQGDTRRAGALAREGLTVIRELGDTWGCSRVLEALACIAVAQHDVLRAVRLFAAADVLRAPIGEFPAVTLTRQREEAISLVRKLLPRSGPKNFDAAWAEGLHMTLDQAAQYAMVADDEPLQGRVSRRLSSRELEVVALVAEGFSTRQIANALLISDKTAKRHLDNIFAKLGVSSRAGATAIALRSGLI